MKRILVTAVLLLGAARICAQAPKPKKVLVGVPTRRSRSALQKCNVCILGRIRRYPL